MAETTTVRAGRRARPGARKTANRFAKLAGGDPVADADQALGTDDSSSPTDTGLIAGMSVIAADDAHRVVQIQVAEIAPHPFNFHSRSQPQPGDPKWDELLNGVRANGVRLPVLVVPREAFIAVRPAAGDQIPHTARYVLVYGHRRRAAALEAGRDTIPAVVDDAIMADDGDLDAMAAENLGRQDLPDLAEAELFARYSEIGLSQRAIAERLGIDQATVSRRLALLLLAPELRQAVGDGVLPSAEGAVLAGQLPYGPPRRWQKTKDPDQSTDRRVAEQRQALRLILDRGVLAARAADRVIAERNARANAAELHIPLVDDPRAELGNDCHHYRVADYQPGADIVGAINQGTGSLELYVRPELGEIDDEEHADDTSHEAVLNNNPSSTPGKSKPTSSGDSKHDRRDTIADRDVPIADKQAAETSAAADAQIQRRGFCAALIAQQPSNADLLKILVRQYLSGVAARSATSAVNALLRDWDAEVSGSGEKARNARAWHRAVAAAELHISGLNHDGWDDDAVAHMELLINRVGYEPSTWERVRLDAAAGA